MCVVCEFSGWVDAAVLSNQTSDEIISKLIPILLRIDGCKIIKSDNAANFTSAIFQDFWESFNIVHRFTAPYNSRGNSLVERCNGELQKELRIINPKPESTELAIAVALCVYKINTRKPIKKQFSPFEIVYHRNAQFVYNMPELSLSKIKNMNQRMKILYEKCVRINDKVMEEKLSMLEKVQKPGKMVFHKNDLIRIRNIRKPGQAKYQFRPWSDAVYKVLKTFVHSKSLLAEKLEDDVRIHRIRIRAHIRNCKKVQSGVDNTDDLIIDDYDITSSDPVLDKQVEKNFNDEKPVEVEKIPKNGILAENAKNDEKVRQNMQKILQKISEKENYVRPKNLRNLSRKTYF